MKVIAINLSTSGKIYGGASIACELHSAHIKKKGVDIELWRMWVICYVNAQYLVLFLIVLLIYLNTCKPIISFLAKIL